MTDEKLLELARDIAGELRDEDYWVRCPICEGLGIQDNAEGKVQCPDCDGEGWSEI